MISDYLSKAERFQLLKAGAMAVAARLDLEDGGLPEVKTALFGEMKDGTEAAKSIMLLAALSAGIPIGVFGHVMGRRIAGKNLREEELKEKIKLYRTAADEMASGLGGVA